MEVEIAEVTVTMSYNDATSLRDAVGKLVQGDRIESLSQHEVEALNSFWEASDTSL